MPMPALEPTAAESSRPPSGGSWRRVFSGTPSVRGALGVLAYGTLALVGFRAQGRLLHRWLPGMDANALYVIGHLVELAEILLFAWAASILERRPFAAYGLPWRSALRARFWQGAAVGICSIAALVLALAAVGGLQLALPEHVGPSAALFAAGYLLLFLVLGFREEFLYRGYGLFALAGQAGFWPAAAVTSAWFAAGHAGNSGETALGLFVVGLFGVLACILLQRSGNLWMPIGFHAAWNWGQTFLFGVSNSGFAAAPGHFLTTSVPKSAPAWLSGGSTGPEGSVMCVALFATLGVVFARWRRRQA